MTCMLLLPLNQPSELSQIVPLLSTTKGNLLINQLSLLLGDYVEGRSGYATPGLPAASDYRSIPGVTLIGSTPDGEKVRDLYLPIIWFLTKRFLMLILEMA